MRGAGSGQAKAPGFAASLGRRRLACDANSWHHQEIEHDLISFMLRVFG